MYSFKYRVVEVLFFSTASQKWIFVKLQEKIAFCALRHFSQGSWLAEKEPFSTAFWETVDAVSVGPLIVAYALRMFLLQDVFRWETAKKNGQLLMWDVEIVKEMERRWDRCL